MIDVSGQLGAGPLAFRKIQLAEGFELLSEAHGCSEHPLCGRDRWRSAGPIRAKGPVSRQRRSWIALPRSDVPDLEREPVRLSVPTGQLYVLRSSILPVFALCLQARSTAIEAAYLLWGASERKWITTAKNTHVSSEAHVPISPILNRRPSTRTGTTKASDRAATPGYIASIAPAGGATPWPPRDRSQGV